MSSRLLADIPAYTDLSPYTLEPPKHAALMPTINPYGRARNHNSSTGRGSFGPEVQGSGSNVGALN